MTEVGGQYRFDGPDGPKTLIELFGEHDELAVYQFMDIGPDGFCGGCTAFTDNVPQETGLAALGRRGIAWATISDMPLAQIEPYRKERGWTLPFFSSRGTTWTADWGIGGGFQLMMFLRDGEKVYRTYATTARGVDRLMFLRNIQDLSVYGRQEDWEDSPAGWPQHPTYG